MFQASVFFFPICDNCVKYQVQNTQVCCHNLKQVPQNFEKVFIINGTICHTDTLTSQEN